MQKIKVKIINNRPTFVVGDWVQWTDYKGRKHATQVTAIGANFIEGLSHDLTSINNLQKITNQNSF